MPADASTGYSALYARAFAAMHDAPAVAVLTRDLSDLRWGTDAAGLNSGCCLLRLRPPDML